MWGGGSKDDLAFGIAADGDGNIYITGRTRGDLDGNVSSGWWEIFLTKYDSSGNRQWTRLLGSATSDDIAHSVAMDGSGNVYIAGVTNGVSLDWMRNVVSPDAYLVQYDSSGNILWTKLLGSPQIDQANGVIVDRDGNVYITGWTTGNLGGNLNAGGQDVFIAKYDSSGAMQWSRTLGASGDDVARGIALDDRGYIYIAGYTSGNLDGNPYEGNSDAFLAKFDTAWGVLQWVRLLGSSETGWANGVIVDNGGNIYISGHTSGNLDGNLNAGGNYDAFLAKYDPSGNKQWTRLLGSQGDDQANGVAVYEGKIFIAGFTSGDLDGNINAGDYDIFWAQYNPDGTKR